MRKKIFTLLLSIVVSVGTLLASDTQVDGIWYDFDEEDLTASVTYRGASSEEFGGEYEGDIVIPSKVTFNGKTYTVTKVGSFACWPYSNLISVVLPSTLTEIGAYAFGGSSTLVSINIPNGVTSIGTYAFYGCTSLISLDIPNSVTSIGSQAFYGITNINYSGNATTESYSSSYWGAKFMNAYIDGDLLYADNTKEVLVACSSTAEGEIVIPNSVTSIGEWAFAYCSGLTSITIPNSVTSIGEGAFAQCTNLIYVEISSGLKVIEDHTFYACKKLKSVTIGNNVVSIGNEAFGSCGLEKIYLLPQTPPTISHITFNQTGNFVVYVPFGCVQTYQTAPNWNRQIEHMPIQSNISIFSTSCIVAFNAEHTELQSCGIEGSEQQPGNVLEFIGLEPESEYKDIPVVLTANTGETETVNISFSTPALELTTKPSKAVSATTAILLAETNMPDAEINCGFEYKRNDAPDDMAGTKVFCPVASGQMAGRLKNLKDDVYYKYRAFYQSSAGNMYYGDWQYIFTGDNAVEFDPILYTYTASVVTETGATLSGYALAGSEDFTEQGFEYWAESRTNSGANAPRRMPAALNEHFFAQANGIKMTVTLTNLDEGTVYKYRAYGKVGNQYYYGSEQTFTTQGEWQESQGIDEVPSDQVQNTKAQKILRNGQIFILRGEKVYNAQGALVK